MLISNAQNFEDVILWRALKHVDSGFYIDIGAQDPSDDSVSLLFYEQGWRGIHVEPSEEYALKLRSARPDEEIIEALVGAEEGVSTFFEIGTSGLSTGSEALANKYRDAGWTINRSEKSSIRLASLLERYWDRDIHWLKIDVEGMEADVINSWHPSNVRPWILVVESTVPNSQIQDHHMWDPVVLDLGYIFVYFDGLNRFYVHSSHSELADCFGPGPNVFDRFILGASRQYFHQLSLQLLHSEQDNSRLQIRLDATADEVRQRDEQLASLQAATRVMERQSEALATEIAQKSQKLAEHEATYRSTLTTVERLSSALAAEIAEKKQKIAELELTQSELGRLRSSGRGQSSAAWLIQGASAWLLLKPGSRPRRLAGRFARASAAYLRERPRAKQVVITLTKLVPPAQAILYRFAAQTSDPQSELDVLTGRQWYLEPEPSMQKKWATLLAIRPSAPRADR
ncbi:FkbM family methyltransferase [Aurantimonas endophytica]|uniref:FkbM family methyltransferase n=1 Tax=Aurantimonas endophytica TaxID=1522175 RepID=A0A7W6MPJ5_9HYPH|nr:FkbM family methyltransferase [Aurantimonas endophytica]MBB4003075.1 FkbM family methyltransferase [Aurantimonas endophytica]MCO6403946.1 FkbM family methyltransferase [Aurantimonas endophytica]